VADIFVKGRKKFLDTLQTMTEEARSRIPQEMSGPSQHVSAHVFRRDARVKHPQEYLQVAEGYTKFQYASYDLRNNVSLVAELVKRDQR
jgi:hypothetical protein